MKRVIGVFPNNNQVEQCPSTLSEIAVLLSKMPELQDYIIDYSENADSIIIIAGNRMNNLLYKQ